MKKRSQPGAAAPTHDPLLRIQQVMDSLSISRTTAHTLIRSGQLAGINVGTTRRPIFRVRQSALDAFIAARSTGYPAEVSADDVVIAKPQ